MEVTKRDGRIVPFDITKIRNIIERCCEGLDVNPLQLESSLSAKFKDKVSTSAIQQEIILTTVSLISPDEPDWDYVAGRMILYNLEREVYKRTGMDYSTPFSEFFSYMIRNGYYDKTIFDTWTEDEIKQLDGHINVKNELSYNTTSALSTMKRYLVKNSRGVIELPQWADMSACIYINKYSNDKVRETVKDYKLVSNKSISLATPFKANLRKPDANLSSCFILDYDDSSESITKCNEDIAFISKNGGGVGAYLGRLRCSDSPVKETGKANNITLWTKIINDIAVAWNQLSQRKGAVTPALDVWHKDILEFIEMKTETGDLRSKAFDLHPQVVLNDRFIEAVRLDKDWYMVDRREVQAKLDIDILNPKVFHENYPKIEELAQAKKLKNMNVKRAKELWKQLLQVYVETGDLYLTHKDNLNRMNPMIDDGKFIQCTNLCTESFSVIEPAQDHKIELIDGVVHKTYKPGLTHTCNLVSLNLSVLTSDSALEEASRRAVRILDKAIEVTTVPVYDGYRHNQNYRTIGVGTLGLADYLAYHRLGYLKDESLDVAERLQEKIAYWTLDESCNIAQEKGSFPEFDKSYFKRGIILGRTAKQNIKLSTAGLDWASLHEKVKKGVRNMMIVAVAPNTGTSLCTGATASYLPVFNKFFYEDFSGMQTPRLPKYLKSRFWYYNEGYTVPATRIVELTTRLQRWIDTGISMELVLNPEVITIKSLSDSILTGFENGLKSVYYSRTLDTTSTETCVSCAN
ncbi:TPA: ribonucleoside-diphosphate reductase subunit alpha [Campylobacter jejuni]|nr:ribonucleoside-diphosphate reductase subunit alpha [Campylobacter jejuni]